MHLEIPLSRGTCSLDRYMYILFNFYTFYHYTSFVYIYSATWNISSSLLMPLIGRSLDFYFFKTDSSLRPHTNILVFYYYYYFVFSVMLEAFT